MPIKNYTTKIEESQSLGEIMGALAKAGARKIMVDYDDQGLPCGLTFGLETAAGPMGFALPANVDGMMAVFAKQKVKPDVQQARRTAWRNVRDWIMAQLAMIETGMVQTEEVFLPYMVNREGQTLFQVYQSGNLMLGGHYDGN